MFLLVLEPAECAFCRENGTEADRHCRNDAPVPTRVVPVGVGVVCRDSDQEGVG